MRLLHKIYNELLFNEDKALPMRKIPIGISSCLIGHPVRYDGSHKSNTTIIGTLGHYFEFHPFCPEVGIGLGIPRTPIHLVNKNNDIRCIDTENPEKDLTDSLRNYAFQQKQLHQNLFGYILKNDSPSCGMEKVKVYENSTPHRKGTGIYAKEMMRITPLLPVENEGRLDDPLLRGNFIQRVHVLYRWKKMLLEELSINCLIQFHNRYKHIISHGDYRELRQMLTTIDQKNIEQTAAQYILQLMMILKNANQPNTSAFFKEIPC